MHSGRVPACAVGPPDAAGQVIASRGSFSSAYTHQPFRERQPTGRHESVGDRDEPDCSRTGTCPA